MHHTKKICLAVTGALALGVCGMASGQSSDSGTSNTSSLWGWDEPASSRPQSWIPGTSYGYVGAGIGQSSYDINCTPGLACDDSDTGFKVFTGGKFSRYLGVEGAYVNLGKANANGGGSKAQGIELSLVGTLPIGDMFSVDAKVGGIYGWTDSSTTVPGVGSGDRHGLNGSYGAGVQLDVARNWAVRGDWDHYRFDYADRNDDVQLYSLNVLYKF
jgi:OOP family OmpA-OmpF porin